MKQLGSHWTDFDDIDVLGFFFEKLLRKCKFYSNLTTLIYTLSEDVFYIYGNILLHFS
jgi:hypothetical protein